MCQCLSLDLKQLDTSAQEELLEKMRLEDIYRPELTALFNRVLKDFTAVVAATGQAIDARNYRPEFDASLTKQYIRTQRFFTSRITGSIEGKIIRLKQSEEEDRSLEALIAAALVAWRIDAAARSSLQITNTNQLQMRESLARARQLISENNLPSDRRTLARTAQGFLKRSFNSRVKRIAVSETQAAAEAVRNIEATALAGKVPFPLARIEGVAPAVPERRITKAWRDIGDQKVRDSHVGVDGTVLPEDGIFIVGPSRSRLRFPGDMLLGAVTAETINCRCFADYVLIR